MCRAGPSCWCGSGNQHTLVGAKGQTALHFPAFEFQKSHRKSAKQRIEVQMGRKRPQALLCLPEGCYGMIGFHRSAIEAILGTGVRARLALYKPAAAFSAATLSVRSQVNSGSSRPK